MTLLGTLRDTATLGAEWLSRERPRFAAQASPRGTRHLALFAWALPPSTSAGVHRPLSFMRYGSLRGWRIDAFSSEPPEKQRQHGDELISLIPHDTSMHVVPRPTREPSYRFFPRVDGGFPTALEYARSAIDSMAHDPPNVVLASGPPFFTFVAAMWVARHFGVPLVLDYRDEWTECPFDFVTKSAQDRHWERRCLRAASAVIFTTGSLRTHQLATFPELRPGKAHLVPNGWEPSDFESTAPRKRASVASEAGELSIAHVGNLSGHTPPAEFLDSLERVLTAEPSWVPRIRVQLIGRRSGGADKAIAAFKFPSVLEIVDHVSKREASQRMQASDVLLVLSPLDMARYLPSKLFDYVASRRPVIVFGARGESSAIVDRLGCGVFVPSGSPDSLRDALVRIAEPHMSGDEALIRDWLAEHRREVLATQAFEIIESLVPGA